MFDGHCPILIVPRHIGMASIKYYYCLLPSYDAMKSENVYQRFGGNIPPQFSG
jgi:hypothetical protein